MNTRGSGFKRVEDEILCQSYILHSENSEVGTYQTREDLWSKIEATYNHEATDVRNLSRRTAKALRSRWQIISSACKLFRACIQTVEGYNRSGSSEVDKLLGAKELYGNDHPKGKTFKFDHAWAILKDYEKWADHGPSAHDNDGNDGNSPLPNDSPLLGDDSPDIGIVCAQQQINAGSTGRPDGRNATKAKRRINAENAPMWQEMIEGSRKSREIMEAQRMDNLKVNAGKEARAKELVDIQKQKIVLKQHKQLMKQQELDKEQQKKNEEIINMDMSKLTPFKKTYYSRLKTKIINSPIPRATRNLDFNASGSNLSDGSCERNLDLNVDSSSISVGNDINEQGYEDNPSFGRAQDTSGFNTGTTMGIVIDF